MRKTVLFSLLLIIYSLAFSSDPVKKLIEEAGDKSDYPGSNLIIIFDSAHVDVQETGLSYVNTHRLYKILTPAGAGQMSVFKYDYDPLSAYVDIKKVVVHRKDGTSEDLDMGRILDYPAPARMIYWGAREKMIEIGRLEPGDALEVFLFRKGFTYALLYDEDDDSRYVPPMKGHFYDIIEFWSSDPVLEKVYQVEIPKEKSLQYEFYNGEVRSSVVFRDDKTIYTFTKTDIMPISREPGMVAFSDVAPKLLMSTSPDWKAKSLWFYGVNEDYGSFESTPEIKAKVDEILADARNEMDSITLLTHWVGDEIRYSGISMGPGEGYTLHSGEMNFTDRCGVCKDKAGMLITMLRAAGFESYPAMTMAGSRIDYIPADQFNHCVTIVKLNDGDYKLLDPTWVPFVRELWSSAEQQQNYLMGVPEGADLAITPLSPPENHYFRLTGNSTLLRDGTLEGEITLSAEGQTDASIRGMFTRNYRSQWDETLEREIRHVAPQVEIIEMDYGNPYEYLSGPIDIKIKFRIPGFAVVSGNEIIFTPFTAMHLFKRGMSHLYHSTSIQERKYPFRDRCSRLVEINETITIPEGFAMMGNEITEKSNGKVVSFSGSLSQSGNTLRLSETAQYNKRIYEASEWPEYRKAVELQNQFAENPVVLIRR